MPHPAVGCGAGTAIAIVLFLVFLLLPQNGHVDAPVADIVIGSATSVVFRNGIRISNVTGHPDRVAVWRAHGTDGLPTRDETTCCQYISDGAHWTTRDAPYRIYQAPTRSFVDHVVESGLHWETSSGGHRILGAAVESGRLFDEAELVRIDNEGTNFVARANLDFDGDRRILGVTRLVMDQSLKHIYQWGIIINLSLIHI